ncbi:hypothetical protein AAVH_13862 [Aphelenchoides avenae]|nr:hypothetical protein AAVH_13862 [Aphelenchus avenae]
MRSFKAMFLSLNVIVLLFTVGVIGTVDEISLTEFDGICAYFPGALHCPGASLEKRSTDGLLPKVLLQQFLSRLRNERAAATT